MSNRIDQDKTFKPGPHADRFADEIRILGELGPGPETDRVLEAFRAVPREHFAGPGPWTIRSVFYDMASRQTPDADPKWLYHCVLVALDEAKGINIGEPSFWARVLSRAAIRAGSRILQVGAGVGYYTAVLRHLAGPSGQVTAFEVDEALLPRARRNLQGQAGIVIHSGNAATDIDAEDTYDLIVGFAGATHVPERWLRALAPGGRVLLPMTGRTGWGAMVLASLDGPDLIGKTLGRCGFYPCAGARHDAEADRLDQFWDHEVARTDGQLRITVEEDGAHYLKS